MFLTKAADLQVGASIHAGWAAFSVDHGIRTVFSWKNEKTTTSYLHIKCIIPQKPQITYPTPFKSVMSQARRHLAKHVSELLALLLYFLILVLNRSNYPNHLQHQTSQVFNGNRISTCWKWFLNNKGNRRRKEQEYSMQFIALLHDICKIWLNLCRERMNLNVNAKVLYPWNISL